MRTSIVRVALLPLALVTTGCSPFCLPSPAPASDLKLPDASDEAAPLPLLVSVKDLMGGAIAFSAHVIDQIEGTDAPLTSGDWGAARAASSDLMATATLLTTPNNNIVDALRRRDAEWRSVAKALQDSGVAVIAASRAQDRESLKSAVSAMHAACQTCHAKHGVHGQ